MMVDLGSVGKGYTAEVLANLMKEEGVTSALFSLGGNIQTVGTKSDGSDWFIGIRAAEEDRYLGGVSVTDKAVVTSGGYERYSQVMTVRSTGTLWILKPVLRLKMGWYL